MALIKITDEEIPYIPQSQRGTEKPLTLYLKYIPHGVWAQTMAQMSEELNKRGSGVTVRQITEKHDKYLFFKAVCRVENYLDAKGKEINDLEDFYSEIDFELHSEIIDTIKSHSTLSEIQRKNSRGA